LLRLLELLSKVVEIHRGLGKLLELLEPLEHFLLAQHLVWLIVVENFVIHRSIIVIRNTLICVVYSRILRMIETHLHLLKEKFLLRLHILLVLYEGLHHLVKVCLLIPPAVRKACRDIPISLRKGVVRGEAATLHGGLDVGLKMGGLRRKVRAVGVLLTKSNAGLGVAPALRSKTLRGIYTVRRVKTLVFHSKKI